MKIKISYDKIVLLIILFSVIFESSLLNLVFINTGTINIVLAVIGFFVSFFCLSVEKGLGEYKRIFLYYLCILLFFIFPQLIYVVIYKKDSWYSFLRALSPYMYVIYAVPILYVIKKNNNIKILFDKVVYIVGLHMILLFIDAILENHNQTGFLILNRTYRNGRLRVWDLSSLEALIIIYCVCSLLYGKGKRFVYLFVGCISVVNLFYIEQTRAMHIAIILNIIFLLLYKYRKNKKVVLISLILVFGLILAFGSGYVQSYINRFTTNESTGLATYSLRMEQIRFVFSYLSTHILCGSGLSYFKAKPYSRFSATDIGLIGMIYDYGLTALVVYVLPMIYLIILSKKRLDYQKSLESLKAFLCSLVFFLVITSATLIITNEVRVFMWPFCIAVAEYYRYELKKDN